MADKMDVDASGSEAISASSSGSSLKQLDTAKLNLDALNESMKKHCREGMWKLRIGMAEDDADALRRLISEVLICLTIALQATEAKTSVIALPNFDDADAIVDTLNEKELGEWKDGVRHGVEENDWKGLIKHRTYIFDYRMVGSHVIATTGKLRKRKVRNAVASGVPIEYRAFDRFPSILLLCSHPVYNFVLA